MRTRNWWSLLPVVAIALAVVTAPALAQEDGTEPSDEATEETRGDGHPLPGLGPHGPGVLGEEFLTELAGELGVTVDELEGAVETVRDRLFEERLAAQVEAGTLTQEQADLIREARELGLVFGPGLRGEGGFSLEFAPGGFGFGPRSDDGTA